MQLQHSILSLPAIGLLGAVGASASVAPAPTDPVHTLAPAPAVSSADKLLRAVPEDAMAFFSAWNLDDLREQGAKSAWYRFYQDEQVQTFANAVGDMISEAWAADPDAPELPFTPVEVWDALHGSVVGFASIDIPNEAVVGGLLIDPAGKREGLEEIFDSLMRLAEGELESSGDSYGGAELTRMSGVDGDGELIFLDHPELMGIVISNHPEDGISAVQGTIDRFSGEDEATGFGGTSALREARATGRSAADFEVFFDLAPIVEGILSEENPNEDERKLLDSIGVTGLRWFYGASDLGAGESSSGTFAAYLPPNSYISDAAQLLGPAPVEMLKSMPAGADQVSVARFDLYGLFKLIMRGIQEQDEEGYQQANGMLQMFGAMGGIDIEKDLLAQITGDFGSFVIPTTGDSGMSQAMMTGLTPGSAMLLGIEDTEEFELFIDDLLTNFQLDQMIEIEEFMGHDVRVVDMGGPKARFTFTDNALVLAGGLEPLQAILRMGTTEDQKTAYDEANLKKLAGPNTLSLSRADTAATMAMQLEMFATLSEVFDSMGMGSENPFAYLPWPDSSIPKKYFKGQLFSTVVREGNTLVMRSWSE